jgi:hypothetical protein
MSTYVPHADNNVNSVVRMKTGQKCEKYAWPPIHFSTWKIHGTCQR